MTPISTNQNYSSLKTCAPVFIVGTSDVPDYTKEMTGDIDYIQTLAKNIQKIYQNHVHTILNAPSPQAILEEIDKNTIGHPILHLVLNPSPHRTGSMLKPQNLIDFKKSGGKLLITIIEFAKYNNYKKGGLEAQENALKYLKLADDIIFLDEHDKQSALKLADQSLQARLEQAHVISVPSTVPISLKELHERGHHIISFGMIRKGKGMKHLLNLAAQLKNSQKLELQDKKLYIVGSVSLAEDNNDDHTFLNLLETMYPSRAVDLQTKTHKELIEFYEKELKGTAVDCPIELHINVKNEALVALFEKCTYAFLPAYRGATLRNSSISSSLANHFITYSHKTDVTPSCLLEQGTHANAIILIPDNSYNFYAQAVLEDIVNRERNPNLNKTTTQTLANLVEKHLSEQAVAQKHCEINYSLSQGFNPTSNVSKYS